MKKAIPIVLMAGGIILLFVGLDAYKAADSDMTRFFTGSATDKSLGIMLGGVFTTLFGVGGLLRGVRVSRDL